MTSGSSMPRVSARQSHFEFAAAPGAGCDVDGEDTFKALHPRHGCPWFVGCLCLGFASGHDVLTLFAVWREHTVKSCEVQTRTRH
jgi:hypothetical protein